MKKHLLLSVLLYVLTFDTVSAQTIYDVRFSNPSSHYAEVDMHLKDMPRDSFDVKMPVWIPGSYMVREFSRHVEGFKAIGTDGSKIRFKKVRKNVWRVYNDSAQALTISYRIYAFELTVRTSFIDAEQAYINGPSVFLYTEETRQKPSYDQLFSKI